MEELGYSKEEIEKIKSQVVEMREEIRLESDPDVESNVSKRDRRHLVWLIEKSSSVLECIDAGGTLPMAALHIGILHQEILNILVPLISKK